MSLGIGGRVETTRCEGFAPNLVAGVGEEAEAVRVLEEASVARGSLFISVEEGWRHFQLFGASLFGPKFPWETTPKSPPIKPLCQFWVVLW